MRPISTRRAVALQVKPLIRTVSTMGLDVAGGRDQSGHAPLKPPDVILAAD